MLTNRSTKKCSALEEETSVRLECFNDSGAAYLVQNKLEVGKEYIAKKILLGALQKNEQEGALMEVNLLKNLQHPNIVSYKTSYITKGMLVIIMEYCEGKNQLVNRHHRRRLGSLSHEACRQEGTSRRLSETVV